MTKLLTFILLLLFPLSVASAQLERTFYFDFGPNDVTNGNLTTSPDANGNYWNNPVDPAVTAAALSLVDKDNNTSDLVLTVTTALASNGIQNGGLLAPEEALLGDFAVATATQDYFFTTTSGSVTISGLNPSRGYVFSMFGSRNWADVRKSRYVFTGANIVIDTLQTSGTDIGGTGYNGNNSTILVSEVVRPDAEGNIQIALSVGAGGFGYINVMKMEEYNIDEHFYVDFGPNDVTNGNITSNPDVNGNYWNNPTDGSVSGVKFYLINNENETSDIYFDVKAAFSTNGILNGALLAPEEALLGEFAIATATQDYFFTSSSSSMEIGGLNPENGYVFSFFASRTSTQTRWSRYTFTGAAITVDSLQTSGVELGGVGYDGNNSTILVTDTISPNSEGIIYLKLDKAAGDFAYINCMKIDEINGVYNAGTLCPERDNMVVAMMGSSVAYGTGATSNHGYAYMYNQQFAERYANGEGADFTMPNISIGGNTTVDVLNRWNSDLMPLCSGYVVYGLSLGNEGIHDQGQVMFDQFRDNMLLLIDMSREEGMEPVVVNCYTRSDFNETDYAFIKEMNLLIHEWDVASINVLGAVDNGAGRWATGYYADGYHPNTAGHTEFFYSWVPSMFDALEADIPQPEKKGNTYLTITQPSDNYQLEFTPEGTVHPFTTSFEIKTTGTGLISAVGAGDGYCKVAIDANGTLSYSSPISEGITGTTVVNDGQWHRITLTHYYAWGHTELFVDDQSEGSVSEKLAPQKFILSGTDAPTADFREWFFYRAGMNEEEINAICNNEMLKSSLELYAPLDGQAVLGSDELVNLAQSMNAIQEVDAYELLGTELHNAKDFAQKCFPNPAEGELHISFEVPENARVELTIYDVSGRSVCNLVNEQLSVGNYEYSWKGEADSGGSIESGYYISRLIINGVADVKGVVFIK